MFESIVVTDFKEISSEIILSRLSEKYKRGKLNFSRLILRAKEKNDADYIQLYNRAREILPSQVQLYWHNHLDLGRQEKIPYIHLSETLAKNTDRLDEFKGISISIHSIDSLKYFQKKYKQIDFFLYGHIYRTNSKKGIPPRGLDSLKEIVSISQVPIIAIGGITPNKFQDIKATGAKGAAMLSYYMNQ